MIIKIHLCNQYTKARLQRKELMNRNPQGLVQAQNIQKLNKSLKMSKCRWMQIKNKQEGLRIKGKRNL